MRRALLYCTFNGVANCTNGIGRQTATLLTAWQHRRGELFAEVGTFDLHVAVPVSGPHVWFFDEDLLSRTRAMLGATGAYLHELGHDTEADFWSPTVWEQISRRAAQLAARLGEVYDEVLVIAVDTPYAGLGPLLRGSRRVQTLLTLYGTAHLRQPDGPDAAWLAWERAGLAATCDPRVRVANVGQFFTRHLITTYGVRPDRFVPWRSSLDLRAGDLQPMPRESAVSVLLTYDLPTDRPIVAFIGRTDPCKGLGHLINALLPIRDRIQLAAIVTPAGPDDPLVHKYRLRIADAGLRATYVPRFTRELPRALCSLPLTHAVACPAHGEVLANVPFEVALWARKGGPIVVAPDRDGFPEQIDHGRTGLLYNPATARALTAALIRAIELPDGKRRLICASAERRVRNERDVIANLGDTLRAMWGDPPRIR